MRARGLLPILLLNVIVSVVVAFGIIAVFRENEEPNTVVEPFYVPITTTPDPNATPIYIVVTATPGANVNADSATAGVSIPAEALAGAGITPGATSVAGVSTQTNVASTPDGTTVAGAQSADGESLPELPAGCFYHTIADGDIISFLGPEYDVSYLDIMAVNNFTDEDAESLNIGDIIIIPGEGCPIEQFAQATVVEVTEEVTTEEIDADNGTTTPDTEEEEGTPGIRPTVTLAPTATDSQIVIQDVRNPGDITLEEVLIVNNGLLTDIGGWTLSDLDGNTYAFGDDVLFFNGGTIRVVTRGTSNPDSAIVYYQRKDQALFSSGDVLTLTDTDGEVQATFRVP